MKKIGLLLGSFCSLLASAQMAPEGFEAPKFPPQDWTIYHLMNPQAYNFNGWSRKVFTDSLATVGKSSAYSLSGKYQQDADSWLITPKVKVRKGDFLNFMVKFEATDIHTEDTLDVMVSVAGKEKQDFGHRVLRILPRQNTEWVPYCIDLSEFADQQIHVAFHDYLLHPSTAISGCHIYLDNVEISERNQPNLSISSIESPRHDCSPFQYVVLNVSNTGKEIDNYTICCQANHGPVLRREVTGKLGFNETKKVMFDEPVEFTPDSLNVFKAWVEYEGSTRQDTITKEVYVGREIGYPYVMGQSATPELDFRSYHATIGKWQYAQTTFDQQSHFVYMGRSKGGFLGSGCIRLPKGKVKVSMKYVTSQHAQIKVFAASTAGILEYKNQVGETGLLLGNGKENTCQFLIDIPKEGLQSLGFLPCAPNDGDFVNTSPAVRGVQFILTDLKIEEATDDLALESIVSPKRLVFPKEETPEALTVRLFNGGLNPIQKFHLNYCLNKGKVVRETVTTPIAAGDTLDYTFKVKPEFKADALNPLQVWVESTANHDHANDTISTLYSVYKTYEMPYFMGGEADEHVDHWTSLNTNQDMVEWQQTHQDAFKGEGAFILPFIKSIPNDDVLVSPAIKLPEGKMRVAFFYRLAAQGQTRMEVVMGRSPEALDSVLFATDVPTEDWVSHAVSTNITEAGTYYFGIRGRGTDGTILLDQLRIDAGVDACVKSVDFLENNSYNLTTSPVKMTVTNCGVRPIENPKLFYAMGHKEDDVCEETYKGCIAPGDTLEYTFQQEADLSQKGKLELRAWIEADDDVEEANNGMYATKMHYANQELPYRQNFEDDADRVKWASTAVDLNEDGNTWIPAGNANSTAYSGKGALYYNSQKPGNDWIFSECLALPAGESELSFFYRTFKNFPKRKENFKVMLGKAQHPDSMTITVAEFKETAVSDPQEYMKVIRRIKLDEPGNYFIGVYTDSPNSKGYIYIDDLLIQPYGAKEDFYASDFSNHFDEWTTYKPGTFFDQWLQTSEEGHEGDFVQMKTFRTYKPGMLVSPGFALKKDEPVRIDLEYALISPNPKDTLALYMGNENHPDSLTTLVATFGATEGWTNDTLKVSVPQDGRYFFAWKADRAGRDKNVLYRLGSFKVTPAHLGSYALKGCVTDAAGQPLSEVQVNLASGQPQATVTDSAGFFNFDSVVEKMEYTLTLSKEGFNEVVRPIQLDGKAEDLGAIELNYQTESPTDFMAVVNDSAKVVELSWLAPNTLLDLSYDDGRAAGNVGFPQGTSNDVMGVVFRKPTLVHEIDWYTLNIDHPHHKVNLYLLALDEKGNPTNKVLYRKEEVSNVDNAWNLFELDEPVEAPNGFMVAVSYNDGSLNLGVDDGKDDYPFCTETSFIGKLDTGNFQSFESKGGKSNFMIRAKGVRLQPEVTASATLWTNPNPDLRYNVYRFADGDDFEEETWKLLTEKPTEATVYTDSVEGLNGKFRYAVKTVYPSNEESGAIISQLITLQTQTDLSDVLSGGLKIGPIPARTFLKVSSDQPILSYALYDAAGVCVSRQHVMANHFSVNVSGYTPGAYLLRVVQAEGETVQKIMIE